MADYQSYGFSGVVAKPYQISDLAKTLKEVSTRCDPSPSVSSPAPLG
jgi:hypothetical protein